MKNTIITFEKISNWSESKKGLLYIICISLMLKAFLLVSDSMVNKDGVLYIAAAQKIAEGYFKEGLLIFPMPFYSILIAGMHFIIPDWVVAARILSVTFVILTLIPLHLMTKELFDRKAAFWACLAFAVAPVPNGWADGVMRDPGFIFCMAWAVFFTLRAIQSQKIIFFAAAVLVSWISTLFRVEGIIFILFSPVYFLVLSFMKDQERAFLLKGALVLIMLSFILIGAIVAYGWNEPVLVNRSGYILEEFKKLYRMEFLENYRTVYEQLIKLEISLPYNYGIQTFAETARHYIPIVYFLGFLERFIIVLFPLFLVPLYFGFKEPILKPHSFLLFVFSTFFLVVYFYLIRIGLIQNRYLAIPMLMLYPWIGVGTQKLFEYLSGRFSKKVFTAIFILFFILPIYKCFEREWKEDRSLMAAAKWIKKEANSGKLKIITTDARFLYYAGREFWFINGSSGKDGDVLYRVSENYSLNYMEQIALQQKTDIMVFRIPTKNIPPQFKYFKKIKEFKGRKNVSYIFSLPEAAAKITGRNS